MALSSMRIGGHPSCTIAAHQLAYITIHTSRPSPPISLRPPARIPRVYNGGAVPRPATQTRPRPSLARAMEARGKEISYDSRPGGAVAGAVRLLLDRTALI